VARRLRQHRYESVRHQSHLGNWLRSLNGVAPTVIALSEVSQELWAEEEIRYIRAARCLGLNLVNNSDGGEGSKGHRVSDATREKISRVHKGKTISPEHREKLSRAGRGRKISAQTRERMSQAQAGRLVSEVTRHRISQAKRGKKLSGASSRFLGVYWIEANQVWGSYLRVKKKNVNLGRFPSETEAARAYDTAAKQFYGQSASLNFQE